MKKKTLVLALMLTTFFFLTGFIPKRIDYPSQIPDYTAEFNFSSLGTSGSGTRDLATSLTNDLVLILDGPGGSKRINNVVSKYTKMTITYNNVGGVSTTSKYTYTVNGHTSSGERTSLLSGSATYSDSITLEYHRASKADHDFDAPVITGTNYYKKKVSEKLTIDDIAKGLTVTDENQTTLRLSKDKYTANSTKIGTYSVGFYAIDYATNVSAEYNIRIDVVADDVIQPPVVSGQNYYSTTAEIPLKVNDIKNTITATDYEGKTIEVYLTSDNYTQNATKMGDHTVVFNAVDKNGNATEFIVTISVRDSSFPEIIGPKTIEVNIDKPPRISEIISKNFTAKHNTQGDLTTLIKVEKDVYTANITKVGTYETTISVTAENGSKTTHIISITIIDTVKPTLSGSNSVVEVTPSEPFNINKFKETLIPSDNYTKLDNKNIYIKKDDYTPNAHKIGVYTITFGVKDSSGNEGVFTKIVEVVEDKENPSIPSDPDKPNTKDPDKETKQENMLLVGIIAGVSLLGIGAYLYFGKKK